MTAPRLLNCGDSALSVDFGNVIDPAVNARVMALDRALTAAAVPGVIDCVPTYRALMVHFDPLTTDHAALCALILDLAAQEASAQAPARRWRVPVVYGGAQGIDLPDLAAHAGLSEAAVVQTHAAPVYRVMMIGFMPGFAYLGGLPAALARPRRDVPRPQVPAGSVSIGGAQTAIGSVACPSGWHLIGRTPVRSFDPARDPPCLFGPGDEIVLTPLPPAAWDALETRAAAGDPLAERLA